MSLLHRSFYYAGAPYGYVPAPCHQWLIDTCAAAVAPDPQYFDAIRDLSATTPKLYSYNSATDDYTKRADGTPHPEGLRVKACADALGVPIETMYLHWAEDTTVTIWLSGGPGPRTYPAGSRIEMYAGAAQSGNALRELCSFVPAARQVQTDAMLQVAKLKSPKGREWDGLFLDNCANVLEHWGSPLVSGGTVLEHGGKITSAAFQGWYWQNLRDWLASFRTVMGQNGKLLAQNVGPYWTDEYCTHWTAHEIVQEFVGNPIRDAWPSVLETARFHRLAETHGQALWASCNPVLGSPAETWAEMQYASLCLHLCVMSKTSSTIVQDWTGPYGMKAGSPPLVPPTWPERVVSPVEANQQFKLLGNPTGDVEVVGTRGPSTRLQKLYCRMFERGAVWVRQLEPYNGLTTETWDIQAGPQMLYVTPSGTTERQATVTIKNGGGAILVRA